MVPLLVLLVLLALAFWVGKEFANARRRSSTLAPHAPPRPAAPPHQRVSDAALQDRARSLRAALRRGDVTLDEAAGSLIRYAGSWLTPEHARQLLRRD